LFYLDSFQQAANSLLCDELRKLAPEDESLPN